MNKSHITNEQVDRAITKWSAATGIIIDDLSWEDAEGVRRNMRRALEAAFPEQQPAAFGKLVVTEDDAEQINYAKDIREALQSFVDAHSIKPIAFADRTPDIGDKIYVWQSSGKYWFILNEFEHRCITPNQRYWLPASALPIPERAVDAMEAAWREYCSDWRSVGVKANRLDFLAGYEAAQAGGAK